MIVILISVFFDQWIDIVNYAAIFSDSQTVREFDPSRLDTSTNNFMFALGVIGIDLNNGASSYFDISLEVIWRDANFTKHTDYPKLSACTVDQWSHFGDEFEATFRRMELNKFVCPPSNYSLRIEGKYTSADFSYMKVDMKRCSSGPNCKTAA
jgi:hypothetical protein